jgi:peptidoglycan L-alanyl-D-glutamate endopeptidase CwlK
MYKLSSRSRSRLDGINPVLIEIVEEAIKDSPFDFGIPQSGGLRTAEDQNKLFNQNVSKCDGYDKKSYHQSGNAFDIYAYVNGRASWETKHLKPIAEHILKVADECFNIQLTWGGNWVNFKDLPHFQI